MLPIGTMLLHVLLNHIGIPIIWASILALTVFVDTPAMSELHGMQKDLFRPPKAELVSLTSVQADDI